MNFRSEVETKNLIKTCFELKKRIAIPYIDFVNEENIMFASEIKTLENSVELGFYNILEPKHEFRTIINPNEFDLIIVPGVAFDYQKNRIGYGAGYYDKFFRDSNIACLKVGLAFDIQIVKQIPHDIHDIKMDIIITESQIF